MNNINENEYFTFWADELIAEIKTKGYKIKIYNSEEETEQTLMINGIKCKNYKIRISKRFSKTFNFSFIMPVNILESYDFRLIVQEAIEHYENNIRRY